LTALDTIATIQIVRKGRSCDRGAMVQARWRSNPGRVLRKTAGVLALAGLVLPGSAALMASVHLSSHHEDDHHHAGGRSDAIDLSVAWHGHSHAEATPDHDHPLLLAAPPPSVWSAATRSFSHEPAGWKYPGFVAAVGQARASVDPPGLTGSGPPGSPGRVRILRI
jgi:hypothetical protein